MQKQICGYRGEGRRGECSIGNYSEGPNWSWSPTFAAVPEVPVWCTAVALGFVKNYIL